MDQFSQPVLSKKLLTIIANSSTSTNQITFKRAIASSDKYKLDDLNGFDDNSIKTIKKASETVFSAVKSTENSIQLTAIFSSNGNASDYEINSLLFTAEYGGQEFLAFSQIANYPLKMPAGSAQEVFNLTLKPKIVIESTKTISTSISPDAIATNEYVEQKSTELNSKIDNVQSEQTDLIETLADKISKTGNPQTVDSKLTFTEKINGIITSADSASSTSTLTLDSGTNLHAITDTGNSTYSLKGTYTNAPSGFTGTGILNRSVSGTNVLLTVTDVSTADKWVQTYNGSSWSNWQQGRGGWGKNLVYAGYVTQPDQYTVNSTAKCDFSKYKYILIVNTKSQNYSSASVNTANGLEDMRNYSEIRSGNNILFSNTTSSFSLVLGHVGDNISAIVKAVYQIPINQSFY